jgi:hypothetical protein
MEGQTVLQKFHFNAQSLEQPTALVSFLETLRPEGQPAARDSSRVVVLQPQTEKPASTQP